MKNDKIAVLVPCHNEEATVKDVVLEFKEALPDAIVYVYDNNSTDNTARIARESGAVVRRLNIHGKGKGFVLQQMFAEINADVYLLVDGDSTYEAAVAPKLINAILNKSYDMAVAYRSEVESSAYRTGHKFGNRLLTGAVNKIFGESLKDMLSGYRALSYQFVKSFPMHSTGFELEAEITIHALELKMRIIEIKSLYKPRPEGSQSKLRTYSDGWRIMFLIINLFRREKPLIFFFLTSIFLALIAIILIFPVLLEYFETGLIPSFPNYP